MRVLGRVGFRGVRSAAVKRLVFLIGVVVLFLGTLILMDPLVAPGDHNCGTALAPKRFVQSGARSCARQIERRRWLGAGVMAVGALGVILPGPRCLLADD
jgi:hypothetical protein